MSFHPAKRLDVLNGSLGVFQAEGPSAGWQTVNASEVVSNQELYSFFRELARPFDPNRLPAPPTPEEMQQLFSAAGKYEYWLAPSDENAAIGIDVSN